jgi:hypothetical protein
MTIRLRPHHMLCLLTYVGKGYTPGFAANYNALSLRLSQGEEIEIVAGPDDICAPLLGEAAPHCWRDSVIARDQAAAKSLQSLGLNIAPGKTLKLDGPTLAHLRDAFAQGIIRPACAGCEWNDLCSTIAKTGFDDVRVACPS